MRIFSYLSLVLKKYFQTILFRSTPTPSIWQNISGCIHDRFLIFALQNEVYFFFPYFFFFKCRTFYTGIVAIKRIAKIIIGRIIYNLFFFKIITNLVKILKAEKNKFKKHY